MATVFNYVPAKEDLFFFRLEAFGAQLVDSVGTRAAGEPVLVAFRRYLLESGGLLAQVEAGDLQALERLRTVNRVIAASPALQAREQQAIARTTDALAALLAADVRRLGQHAFALLGHGLGDYAAKPGPTSVPAATRSKGTEAEGVDAGSR